MKSGNFQDLAYLSAVLAMKQGKGPEVVTQLLNEAIELHFAGLKGLPLGIDYYCRLNPDFLLQVSPFFIIFKRIIIALLVQKYRPGILKPLWAHGCGVMLHLISFT